MAYACCCKSVDIRLRANLVYIIHISAQEFSIRSAWRQSRALLSIDPSDVRIAKLERHKARLQRKHFGHSSGRRAFFRERHHRAARTTKKQKVSPERRSIT